MFIAFIGEMPVFFSSVTGGVPLSEVSGVAGTSIIIGVAVADGLALGFLVLAGLGAVVVGEGDGPIVIPGIGAIVGWGED